MTYRQHRELAASLGLDPKRIVIREAIQRDWGLGPVRQYRFEYSYEGKVYDYNFIISRADYDSGLEAMAVKFYVNKGMRELAAIVNGDQA